MKNRDITLTTIVLVVACYAFSPKARAVSPAPDGGYPGGNTAEGQNALFSLSGGGYNTAVGFFSLRSNTTNSFNTAIGAGTLLANTADQNTATGAGALLSNTTGGPNTAIGAFALFSNTEGYFNTASGHQALFRNTTGSGNTANGAVALFNNTQGGGNAAVGDEALITNTTGNYNTALGLQAGSSVLTASNVICIGSRISGADVSGTCFIGSIRGVTTINNDALPVLIDSTNQLGTISSSRRFKKEIKPMDKASDAILALKPVTFHYKSDKTNRAEFGLIAEEVAEVNPDLVVRDKNGEIYTVRYEAVNAMLLNEFLKEHRKVQEQDVTIGQLKKDLQSTVAQLAERLNQQASQIQRVNALLELSKPAAQTVLNNP